MLKTNKFCHKCLSLWLCLMVTAHEIVDLNFWARWQDQNVSLIVQRIMTVWICTCNTNRESCETLVHSTEHSQFFMNVEFAFFRPGGLNWKISNPLPNNPRSESKKNLQKSDIIMERKSQDNRTMLCFKFKCIPIGFHMLESILANRNAWNP